MLRNGRLREAELTILNAPFEEGGWERAVAAIGHATGTACVQLIGIGGPMLLPLNVFSGSFGSSRLHLQDPRLYGASNWRIGTTTVAMAVQHDADYAAYRSAHDTSDYDDAVSDLDIQYGCQSALLLDQNNLLGLALLRSRREGPCDAETLAGFTRLRHHMARAVRMQLALDGEAAELMVGDLDALTGATLLLNRHGTLCALTPAAEALLEAEDPIRLSGLEIRLRNVGEDRLFQQALSRLLSCDSLDGTRVHNARLGRTAERPQGSWSLFITRLPQRPHGLGFEPQVAVTLKRCDGARPGAG